MTLSEIQKALETAGRIASNEHGMYPIKNMSQALLFLAEENEQLKRRADVYLTGIDFRDLEIKRLEDEIEILRNSKQVATHAQQQDEIEKLKRARDRAHVIIASVSECDENYCYKCATSSGMWLKEFGVEND